MRKSLTFAVIALGGSSLLGQVQAQESLGGVGAASAMGATLGAAAAGGVSAGRTTSNVGGATSELMSETDNAGAQAGGTTVTTNPGIRVTPRRPVQWGTPNGVAILNQLVSTPTISAAAPKLSPRAQANRSRRVGRQSKRQRTREVMAKYKPAPRAWIAHYLPADRFKVTSNVWKFVSTETDRFYYRPDAPAMLRQSPNRVIGFHSWQDAMLAGYRPDPYTKPSPANEFAYMARLTRGPQLAEYAEFAYSGQVTPVSFAATYKYVRQAMASIEAYPYANPLRGGVVDKIIEATLTGNPSIIPRFVGGQIPQTAKAVPGNTASGTNAPGAGGNEALIEGGGKDKRGDEFNSFRNNAGKMANVPANN